MKRNVLYTLMLGLAMPMYITPDEERAAAAAGAAAGARAGADAAVTTVSFWNKTKVILKDAGSFAASGAVVLIFAGLAGFGWGKGKQLAERNRMAGANPEGNDNTMTTGQAGARGGNTRQRAI